ncbi:hypothetical protein WICMUC_000650 [Wickerhamomyces mucosus]|uniref:Amino acid transporter transmembrane domain-containing protein n=1 Tax=Wickerhamomyces mucosus TaxID=1378264 RepID=A0A9P8PWR2_9ASCO|nr:hypothetical protein WICMUC_000650 [Wickerhamomyces mucosus]
MASYKTRKSNSGLNFSTSFKNQAGTDNMDDHFRTGDFSSKHLTRTSTSFTTTPYETHCESPNTKRMEGGFQERNEPLADAVSSSAKSNVQRNSLSSLTNLLSTSTKQESPIYHPNTLKKQLNTLTDVTATLKSQDPPPDIFRTSSPSTRAETRSPVLPTVAARPVDVTNPQKSTVETIGRHLVQDSESVRTNDTDEGFDSLQLHGGDISRELYNWQKEHSAPNSRRRRSQSFSGSLSGSITEPDFQVHDIRVPGGFRRSFFLQKASRQQLIDGDDFNRPTFIARNFIEFLTLYGHFAGEELRDEDDDLEEGGEESAGDEESLLLPSRPALRRKLTDQQHKANTTKAVLLLLKAFVGTGVLFLPKGFQNAGWGFSLVALVFFSVVSYFCFMLLINSRIKIGCGSYGDIGGELFGPNMRLSILTSIVLSQIGFAAAYIVFTATNLQAFFQSILSKSYPIEFYIILQLLIFIPFSLTRRIAKLSGAALVADLFILLGLVYVYYYCSFVVLKEGISPSIKVFNKDWTVFIGTAIFTYEGIGLLIPIQESMKKPSQFPVLLFWVMFSATLVFISAGLIGYLAFGKATQTVILLNFPQDSLFVSFSQFLYSMAILLSTPLQLFPAIRILENGLFTRSGKNDAKVKWEKNYFRIGLVFVTSLIAWGGASNLDRFVAIIGSFACIPLIYVYPPLLHYKTLESKDIFQGYVDISVCTFGISIMVYTTYQTLSDWF